MDLEKSINLTYERFLEKYPHISIEKEVIKGYYKTLKENSTISLDHLADYILSKGLGDVQE